MDSNHFTKGHTTKRKVTIFYLFANHYGQSGFLLIITLKSTIPSNPNNFLIPIIGTKSNSPIINSALCYKIFVYRAERENVQIEISLVLVGFSWVIY